MTYKIDKDELKKSLSIDEVFNLVAEMGGNPQMKTGFFVSETICHNHPGEGSHKLYYYENPGEGGLFKCYTDCGDTFDIYELVRKQMTIKTNEEWSLGKAIYYVANFFGVVVDFSDDSASQKVLLPDWDIFKKYEKNSSERDNKIVELRTYNKDILKYYPRPIIAVWEREGITAEVMKERGICYDPVNEGIIIPHYDIDNNLIGIRERTLIKEKEKYGKYLPAKINGVLYNHPLSFNLYNLNNSKDNIKAMKKAIIFEGEKGPLMYASYFGMENDISVAVCGSNLISYQVNLLLSLGAEEIIIAFDKQFEEIGDKEWENWTKKLTNIHTKYGKSVQISYMFDKNNLLGYKCSPIDCGKNIFLKMFTERVTIE